MTTTPTNAAPNAVPNADHLPDDAFGYSCYALVLPADETITALANRIEQAAGMTRAKIPAHITVKGTFYGIDALEIEGRKINGLEEVQRRVQAITQQTPAFDIPLAGAESRWSEKGGGLGVRVTPALQSLHDALVAAISPLGKPAYQDDPYRPHMTYVQDVTPAGLAIAKAQVEETDFGPVFRAQYVDLMGRIGQAHGGRWTRIARFPLAG